LFNSLNKFFYLGSAAHDIGFSRSAAAFQNGFEERLGHPRLAAEYIGDQASRLTSVKRDAHEKPREAGYDNPHLLGDCIFDDGPKEGAVLQVNILLDSFSQKGSACWRKPQAVVLSSAFKVLLDGRVNPKGDLDEFFAGAGDSL
jgi:hypothetical protein